MPLVSSEISSSTEPEYSHGWQGTLSDPDMLRSHPDAAYLLSLLEVAPEAQPSAGQEPEEGEIPRGPDAAVLAACAVDVASGHMLLGQW